MLRAKLAFNLEFSEGAGSSLLTGYEASRKCKRFPEAGMSVSLWSSVARGPSVVQTALGSLPIKVGKDLILFPKAGGEGGRFWGSNKTSFCCIAFLVSYLSFNGGRGGEVKQLVAPGLPLLLQAPFQLPTSAPLCG